MLELKFMRENVEMLKEMLKNRNSNIDMDAFVALDAKRREVLSEVETLKRDRNNVSAEIANLKKEKKDASHLIEKMGGVSSKIKELDAELVEIDEEIKNIQMTIPNVYHPSTPIGPDEDSNKEIRRWGEPRKFDFEPKAHWDIGEGLGILDFERGSKLSGSRFVLYRGAAARLERALISFMLDTHTLEHGYTEHITPFMVKAEICEGTGQLPKFEEDMYKTTDDMYLISTSEITMTNIHRKEILEQSELPKYYTAYSPCFRREAGSYGRDVKGLIRLHQFNKVEMVKITDAESSYDELEKMVNNAETILQRLELPYRVIQLCSGDLGFSAAKTYDLEVWLPSQNKYREISSCSNCEAFQARRMGLKYKVGDTVEVLITGVSEEDDDQEYIIASRKKIEVEKNWEKIEDSFKNKTVLEGEVTKKIKGGYLVQALFHAGFLPNSLSEIPENEEKVNGRKVQVIVKDIKVDPKDKRNKKITYSVKDIKLAEQAKEFAGLEVGQTVDCVVTEVLEFGLAVDINALKGFIHISEVSWKRLDKLADAYKVGDKIKAVVVSLDEAKKNVKISEINLMKEM